MDTSWDSESLTAFQDDIKERFLRGEIRHPIHLCDPNQIPHLLHIFKDIEPRDWLFTTYRGLFHWLLKGVPPDELRDWIIQRGAMNFCDAKRRIISSAIVGGCLPIALGTALGLKLKIVGGAGEHTGAEAVRLGRGQDGRQQETRPPPQPLTERVWCFVGDMAAETGGFHEALKYAGRHDLPLSFIIEDNGLSTNTPTHDTWGAAKTRKATMAKICGYERTVPHVGVGQWVNFS